MESEKYEYMRHKVGHFRKDEDIPTHKHHVSIIFQEVIPRDKSFATHRAGFFLNYVLYQIGMNLENMRVVFVHSRPRMKKLLHVLHRCHGFREM